MMNKILLIIILININEGCLAQYFEKYKSKPSIDTSDFKKWISVQSPVISNNGKYFLYTIRNKPVGSETVFLVGLDKNDLEINFSNVKKGLFTEDSHKLVFVNNNDSLFIFYIGNRILKFVAKASSFELIKSNEEEWLVYKSSTEKKVGLVNFKRNIEYTFENIVDYLLSRDGNNLILKTESLRDNKRTLGLEWVNFPGKQFECIWEGENVSNLILSESGNQLAFITQGKDGLNEKSIWHYKKGDKKANVLIYNQSEAIGKGIKLERISSFSNDNCRLFVVFNYVKPLEVNPDMAKVDIWSYSDDRLQSKQLSELENISNGYLGVVDIAKSNFIQLQRENEEVRIFNNKVRSDIAVVTVRKGEVSEWNWNIASRPIFYLESTITGERKELPLNYPYKLSPNGKFLVGTDSKVYGANNNFIFYDIETGKTVNITQNLPVPLDESEVFGAVSLFQRDLKILRWFNNDNRVLIADKYDVWCIDLYSKKAPINLTNGYGRKHNIVFRPSGMQDYTNLPLPETQKDLLLSAFDLNNKNCGFYKLSLNKSEDPELLTMGPYYYDQYFDLFAPLKARDAGVYVLLRETSDKSPNYFWTKNFKVFAQLSFVSPEKNYNWLTTQLINFMTLDGRKEQGILYKPENFDSSKRYPLIIHYYETMSNDLNKYKKPSVMYNDVNVPWFVSRQYLVFIPDIHYKIGEPGRSAYNSIVGASKYLSKLSYVDSTSLGLQGHSFGGFETNYIITHTNLFAAAMSSSGFSDYISSYGALVSSGNSNQYFFEVHQCRVGATLWEKPAYYIENSPIFNADKVTTPLLMMNNKKDLAVSFEQGIEFFTALRRLGKKVWMLQYDGEGHSLNIKSKAAVDYTIRMTQFFDHYLKRKPAPMWMMKGIPAKLKGIDNGLNLITK